LRCNQSSVSSYHSVEAETGGESEQLKNVLPHQWLATGEDQGAKLRDKGQAGYHLLGSICIQLFRIRFSAPGMAVAAEEITPGRDFIDRMDRVTETAYSYGPGGDTEKP